MADSCFRYFVGLVGVCVSLWVDMRATLFVVEDGIVCNDEGFLRRFETLLDVIVGGDVCCEL